MTEMLVVFILWFVFFNAVMYVAACIVRAKYFNARNPELLNWDHYSLEIIDDMIFAYDSKSNFVARDVTIELLINDIFTNVYKNRVSSKSDIQCWYVVPDELRMRVAK